jgi:hypothetical protein
MAFEGNYRDELAAAHARIAELEEKLAEAEGRAPEPTAPEVLAPEQTAAELLGELCAKREKMIEQAKGESRVLVLTGFGLLLFLVQLIPHDHVWLAVALLIVTALGGAVAWIGRKDTLLFELQKIDQQIGAVKLRLAPSDESERHARSS